MLTDEFDDMLKLFLVGQRIACTHFPFSRLRPGPKNWRFDLGNLNGSAPRAAFLADSGKASQRTSNRICCLEDRVVVSPRGREGELLCLTRG